MRRLNTSVTSSQSRITQFFPILNQCQELVRQNKNLSETLSIFMERNELLKSEWPLEQQNQLKNDFLQKLLERADSKRVRKVGDKCDETLSLFCSYLFTIGGRLMYETLHANLPIPSLSTVSRLMNTNVSDIEEGICRFKELKNFLVTRQLPLIVWISEDATRILEKVQYDSQTNRLVGFVLPLSSNGFPKPDAYIAESAAQIEHSFKTGKTASLAYTVMAQSVHSHSPTFCFCLYGTDNKFNYKNVRERWQFIYSGLKKEGIEVLGVGSDGDPRLLKAMRIETE